MEVKCKLCWKFSCEKIPEFIQYHPFEDKKTDWANWVVFRICPTCFDEKIPKDQKHKCLRCERQNKLCKILGNEKKDKFEYYCSWCSVVDLGECVFCDKNKITIGDFNDILSYKEFKISKQCQSCQNEVFNKCQRCKNVGSSYSDMFSCEGCGLWLCKNCKCKKCEE